MDFLERAFFNEVLTGSRYAVSIGRGDRHTARDAT